MSYIDESNYNKLRKAQPGSIIIATTSENDEDLGKAVAWLGNKEVAVSGDSYIYKHSMNPKYVSYFFSTYIFHDQKKKYITGTKVLLEGFQALHKQSLSVYVFLSRLSLSRSAS